LIPLGPVHIHKSYCWSCSVHCLCKHWAGVVLKCI